LGEKMALPERKLTRIEEFVARFPGVERVMIDGTKRPIQPAQERERQKLNYSAKKRRHTRFAPSWGRPTQASIGVE
jgi:hypothetical protein